MAWKGVLLSSLLYVAVVECSLPRKALFLDLSMALNLSPGWPVLSAGVFVLAAVVLSAYLIFQHLVAYNQPEEQKFLIGLILMVPIYAVESIVTATCEARNLSLVVEHLTDKSEPLNV